MCVFNAFFMHLGPNFSPFGHDLLLEKIFLITRETECWTKLFSDSHDFFYFFSTACFFDLCPRRFWKVLHGNGARAYCRTTTAKHFSAQAS